MYPARQTWFAGTDAAFEAAGISYMDVTLYDTITPEESPLAERIRELLKEGAIEAATFTSGRRYRDS